jgi:very-short-patch-repair endonuclease
MRGRTPRIQQAAKQLRADMTRAEQILWAALRPSRMKDLRFRRQHAIGRFILDFYCPARMLAVEVDGGIHDDPDQAERDAARTQALAAIGIEVLRIRNEQVEHDLDGTLTLIRDAAHRRPERFAVSTSATPSNEDRSAAS